MTESFPVRFLRNLLDVDQQKEAGLLLLNVSKKGYL